jgi:hypothetical protein
MAEQALSSNRLGKGTNTPESRARGTIRADLYARTGGKIGYLGDQQRIY